MLKPYLIILLFGLSIVGRLNAQAPSISYAGPKIYTVGTTITALSPTNTGGSVPVTTYGQVSTFAGSGNAGFFDGTGVNSSFSMPVSGAFDAAGNLYIADRNNLCVRKITPAGVVSTVAGGPGAAGFQDGTVATAFFRGPMGLAIDATGNIYVADQNNYRIRKITPAGIVSTLAGNGTQASIDGDGTAASFTNPVALTIDVAGNLYVADGNMIRKITPAGAVTTFAGSGTKGSANGLGALASFNAPSGVAADKAGNIYVADMGNNLIRKIAPDGTVTTLAGTGNGGLVNGGAATAQFKSPSGIGVDVIGNIYITDYYNLAIRMITPGGIVNTIAGNGYQGIINGSAASAQFNLPTGVTPDGKGNIYIADQNNNLIRKVVLTGYTISPSLPAGLNFDSTTGIINGNPTVISPATNYTITAYNASGNSNTVLNISTVVPSVAPTITSFWPKSVTAGQQLSITGTNLSGVTAIAVGGVSVTSFSVLSPTTITATIASGSISGNITVTNPYGTSAISGFKILVAPQISYTSPQTYYTGVAIAPLAPVNAGGDVPAETYHMVSTYAGTNYIGFANGPALSAAFYDPNAIAIDGAGNMYVADEYNSLIRKIGRDGMVTTFAGNGSRSFADGFGTDASFDEPVGVVTDKAGNLYVVDFSSYRVRKITPAGVVSTIAGSTVSGRVDGTGAAASFVDGNAVVTDAAGNIYVSEQNEIRKITPAGVVTTLAGNGISGTTNGTGTGARFNQPSGMAFDAAGNMYVADKGNFLIRKITPAGVVSTVAGIAGKNGNINGNATVATFNDPVGIAVDAAGNIYVSETNDIRLINPAGIVSTLAGNFSGGNKNSDISTALFNKPVGLSFDTFGNLYIADHDNGVIRKIALTGYTISPALPAGLSFDATTGIISGTPTVISPATTYTITAYNAVGSSATTMSIATNTTATQAPIISIISPAMAIAGTTVTISGGNFTGTTSVSFGGVAASSFNVVSPTSIVAVVGNGASGNVTVTNPAGTATFGGFTYTATPTIIAGAAVGTISACAGTPSSSPNIQQFTASGSNLSAGITATAPANFEVSLAAGSGYGSSIVIPQLGGTANTTIVYVRSAASASGNVSGNIVLTSTGAATQNVAVSATINTLPVINSLPNQTVTNGSNTVVNFTGTAGSTINWINNNPAIGLTTSGTGDISFTAVNNSSSSATATIVATPVSSTGAGCSGLPVTFTITVQPSAPSITTSGNLEALVTDYGIASSSTSFTVSGSNLTTGILVIPPQGFEVSTDNVNFSKTVTVGTGGTIASTTVYLRLAASTPIGSYSGNVVLSGTGVANVNITIANSVVSLPSTNFKLTITSATCKGSNNGSVNITAAQNIGYVATITGNGLNKLHAFTSSTDIDSLSSGTYNVCIGVQGNGNYKQCYDVVITEPKDLSVYSTVNDVNNTINLSLAGAQQYNIVLNGALHTTTDNTITLPLKEGNNELSVSTDKLCQGIVQKVVNFSGKITPYPVPFQNSLSLNLGNSTINNVSVELHNVSDGKVVYTQKYVNQSGVLQLDLTALKAGVYALHLSMDNSEKIFKIIKK